MFYYNIYPCADFFVQSLGVLFFEISIAVLQEKFAGRLDFLEKILNEGPVYSTMGKVLGC